MFFNRFRRNKIKSQERDEVINGYIDKDIRVKNKRGSKFSLPSSPKFQIEDRWMNEKCAKLISKHRRKRGVKTSNEFFENSRVMSSQYSVREDKIIEGSPPNKANFSFYNSNTPSSGYGFFNERQKAVDGYLIKKDQKLRFTMEELKLTCNQPTFQKFYQIKRKVKDKEKFYINAQKVKTKLWRPQVREEFTLDTVPTSSGKLRGFLIGGFNGNGIKQIVKMGIQQGVKPALDWKILEVQNHDELQSKFSQATCVDGKYIYIFGGADLALKNTAENADGTDADKVLQNQKLNISRQCTSQLMRFDTDKNELEGIPQGDYIVSPKRDHCIAKFGRFILSFGGINDLGRVLSDVDFYDLNSAEWQPLQVTNPIEGICYSTCTPIFYPDRFKENKDNLELNYIPPPEWGKVEHLLKEEGIYLFGGRNKNSEVNGDLKILKLGNKLGKNNWIYPDTLGRPPCPRYQHCMVHMARQNLLVIHGGRTSQNVAVTPEIKLQNFLNKEKGPIAKKVDTPATPMSFTLGDIFALKLDSLEWIRVITSGDDKLARANHSMARLGDDSLLIFGGNAVNSTYCSSDYILTFTDENMGRRGSYQISDKIEKS